MLAGFPGLLNRWTLIPELLLFYAGISLFPVALFIAVTALRHPLMHRAVECVIAGNVLWVIGSIALLGLTTMNGLGAAFILTQALAVALLTWLEYAGLYSASRSRA
jgi:glucose uptake protein GlcU